MLFLIVLAGATAIAAAALLLFDRFKRRTAARLGMAVAMAITGLGHIVMPTPFVQHMPAWVPARDLLVTGTGVIELILGSALLIRTPLRRLAGLALASYLLIVLPANMYVAVSGVEVDGQPGGYYPWLRLPLQALFIAWALWSTSEPADVNANRFAPSSTTSEPR